MTTKRQYLCPTTTTLVVNIMQIMASSPLTVGEEYDDDNSRRARERNSWSDGSDTQTTDGSSDSWGGIW